MGRNIFPRFPCRIAPLTHCLSGLLLVGANDVCAKDYFFSASSLEGKQLSQDVDLSLFSKQNGQLPGVYTSTIIINKQKVDETPIRYLMGKEGALEPQLTPELLAKWGIRVEAFPELAALSAGQILSFPVDHFIPAATAQFEFNDMTLKISMPQAAIKARSRDYVDPARWDDGMPVLFTDYAFSGSSTQDDSRNNSQYLSLRNGANLGGWRLRNTSTWNNSDSGQSWQTLNTWLQHDVDALKAQFTAGESSTRGEVFDSIQYKGVDIASDDDMLPYSQRGFAPVIRGVAASNAEVSVRQNGYVIYQANVAPGAFEINDLYSTTNSGDLEVTVKEADGSEHRFTLPYSSLAVMQRPGHVKYEFTAARYRADNGVDSREPLFAQGSVIYGLNNRFTLFGGSTVSDDYLALNAGTGIALGMLGAISTDVTWARTTLDNGQEKNGQSWRVLYTGNIESTDTSFTLASYRYSTRGYYSFADANLKSDNHEDDWQFQYQKRNRLQASINQTLLGSSLYLTGYQQDYWNTGRKERSLSSGINRTIGSTSVHLAYSYSKNNDSGSDRMISFGISVPLSAWLPKSWATYNISNSKNGDTQQNLGLSGTLLDDNRLSYSLQQSRANHDGDDSSNIYGSYRSQYANLNAGYYYASDNTRQLSYGINGALVAHPHGVTLSQPLGNQFAIISASDASGVRFINYRGVQTDWQGNAVIPSLTAYQENTIRVDTTSLPEDVETDATAVTLVPTRNAAVSGQVSARVGYRVLMTLSRPDGQAVPFGAVATAENAAIGGIVDDNSTLYLSGISGDEHLLIKWGNAVQQQCRATLTLAQIAGQTANPSGIRTAQALCQQEDHNAS